MALSLTAVANVDGRGIAPSYQIWALSGAMNGATPIEATVTVTQPIKAGSLSLALTGGTDTNVITASVRSSTVPSASAKAANSVFNGTTTVGAAGDGAATTAYKIFAFPTSGVIFGPGDYIVRLVANAAETATVGGLLHLQSLP